MLLKKKILLSHLSIILITALTLGVISYDVMMESLRKVERDRMLQTAAYGAKSLDLFFTDTVKVMHRLSGGKAASGYPPQDEKNTLIEYFLKFSQVFPLIIFADKEGIEQIKVLNEKAFTEHNKISYPVIFNGAIEHPNEVVLSEILPIRELGEPGLFFAIARYDNFDKLSDLILGAVPLSNITNTIFNTSDTPYEASYLIDHDGTLIAAPDPDQVMTPITLSAFPESDFQTFLSQAVSSKTWFCRADIMGCDSLIAGSTLTYRNWAVLVTLPYKTFIAPLNTLRSTGIAITLFIILISSVIALALSESITRPLSRLIHITESVAGGNLSERLTITSKDELGVLSRYFNTMIDDLDTSRAGIIEAKDRLQDIISSMMEALIVLDPEFTIKMVNSSACNLLHYTEPELLGKPVSMIFAAGNEVISEFAGPGGIHNTEKTLRSRSGKKIETLFSGSIIRDTRGTIQGMVCVARDITDRKMMEQKLRESEHKYRSLLERANDGIIILQDSIIGYANPRITTMLGYSIDDIQGAPIDQIMAPEERNLLMNVYSYAAARNRTLPIQETTLVHNDSHTIQVEINAGLINFRNRPAYLLIIRNITERLQLQKKQMKAERLESIGILAGGIAHDFNNILTGILGNISLARLYIPEGNKALEKLTASEEAVSKAQDLTSRLRTFAKGGAPHRQLLHIGHLIREAAESVLNQTPVTVRYDTADNLWLTESDPEQMHRVFKNLFLNAAEAMDKVGVIDISIQNMPAADREYIPDSFMDYIQISITDHGKGIPAHHMNKLFDPYFSTKQRGTQKGMGLGLTIVHSIITRHGGTIRVRSHAGIGTTFTLYLPAIKPSKQTD